MEGLSAIDELYRLIAVVVAFDEDLERETEPDFEAVLQHILAHPNCRPAAGDALLDSRSKTDGLLFGFCMHVLRWPEVQRGLQKMIEAAVDSNDRRAQFALESIASCFEDNWDCRLLYDRFSA